MRFASRCSAIPLLLFVAIMGANVTAEDERSFAEKLRTAAEAQRTKQKSDEELQQRLADKFAADGERNRQSDISRMEKDATRFQNRLEQLRREDLVRSQQLEQRLKGVSDGLADDLNHAETRLAADEFGSHMDFKERWASFVQELRERYDAEKWRAKTEDKIEQRKRLAASAAMAYFTGGASLAPILGEGIISQSSPTPAPPERIATKSKQSTQPTSDSVKKPSVGKPDNSRAGSRGVKVYDAPAGPPLPPSSQPYSFENPEPGIEPSVGLDDLIPWRKAASWLGWSRKVGRKLGWFGKVSKNPKEVPTALNPVGRRGTSAKLTTGAKEFQTGKPLKVMPGANPPLRIGGRDYSGHALDRMQERGLVPSVVENTIKVGKKSAGNQANALRYFDPKNKVTVIINKLTGRVITVE